MRLGPIHVVTGATMAIMQGMIHRLANELTEMKGSGAGLQLDMLKRTLDPQMLHTSVKVRLAPQFQTEPDADAERSRHAVRRVLAAYQRARAEFEKPAPSMWDYLEKRQASSFVAALNSGDEDAVLEQLRAMLRTDLVWGLGCVGAEVWNHTQRPYLHGSPYQIRFTDKLVTLAEAVGAQDIRNPDQNRDGYLRALDVDLGHLLAATERRTGLDLSFPEVCGAFGCVVNGRGASIDSLTHGYTAARLRELGAAPGDGVAEIGGGYGCLALLMYRAGFTDYTIYDLPWVNTLQGYFLVMALPPNSVRLYGEDAGTLAVVPGWCFERIADRSLDYVVKTNSLPEMGAETAHGYLRDIRRGVRQMFLSINQEAKVTPWQGCAPQLCVAELIEELGGFQRRSRSRFWMMNGYVEEVYEPHTKRTPR